MPCAQKPPVEPHLGQNLHANTDFIALSDVPAAIGKSTVSYGSSFSSRISSLGVWVSSPFVHLWPRVHLILLVSALPLKFCHSCIMVFGKIDILSFRVVCIGVMFSLEHEVKM